MINKLFYIVLAALIFDVIIAFYQNFQIRAKNKEIAELSDKILLCNNKFTLCDAYLQKQNAAIKDLKLKKSFEPTDTSKIEKIFIKDKTCESELNAYKRLFDE